MFRKITKAFLLNGTLKVDPGASIQALYDFMSTVKFPNKRDTNRLQVAKEHLRSIKQHVRKLNEQVNSLEEQLRVLNEEK